MALSKKDLIEAKEKIKENIRKEFQNQPDKTIIVALQLAAIDQVELTGNSDVDVQNINYLTLKLAREAGINIMTIQ